MAEHGFKSMDANHLPHTLSKPIISERAIPSPMHCFQRPFP